MVAQKFMLTLYSSQYSSFIPEVSPKKTTIALRKAATTPKKSCMKRVTETPPPRNSNANGKGLESHLRFLESSDSDEDDIDD